MQNKLLSGSHKEEKRQRVGWCFHKRMKGGNSLRSRARGPEFFLFTMLTVILFTALLWSYEPHLSSTLLSIQDQFLLPASGDIQELMAPDDRSIQEKFLERAQTEEEVAVNVEKPKVVVDKGFSKPSKPGVPSVTKPSYGTKGSLAGDKGDKENVASKGSSKATNQDTIPTKAKGSSINEGSLAKEKENKISTPYFEKTEKEDKPNRVTNNAENAIDATQGSPVGKPKGSSTNEWSSTRKKEFKDSTSTFEQNEKKNKPNRVTNNVEKSIVATQDSPVAEPKGSSTNEWSSARENESKDSTSTFEKKEKEDKPNRVTNNAENAIVATQGSPVVESKGSSTNEWSSTREKESKVSTSTFEKKELEGKESFAWKGSAANQGSPPSTGNGSSANQGYSPKDKEEKDSTSISDKIEQVAQSKESFASEESSTTQGSSTTPTEVPSVANASSTTEWSTTKEKEDRTSSFIDNKKDQVTHESVTWKDSSTTQGSSINAEGTSVANSSSTTELSTTKEKEDKNPSFVEEKKAVQEPLHVHSKIEEKPKQQDNVESTKPKAKESFASNGSSTTEWTSAVQGSPATDQWSSAKENKYKNSTSNYEEKGSNAAQGSSVPTEGSPITEWSHNNSASTSQEKVCNYAKGRWVWDNRRPLYNGSKCKRWLSWMWACRITNRQDFRFESYKWQPDNCDMPDFERHTFLKRMQNKTIAFVGDSLGRQQFQSMMCMLTGGDDNVEVQDVSPKYNLTNFDFKPTPGRIHVPRNGAFRFPETNTTIIYHWTSCLCDLVPLNTSDPKTPVAMHLDQPPSFLARFLPKFDVLVLNTGHHWNRGKIRQNRWVMHVGGAPAKNFHHIGDAKNLTIVSIAKWVDSQLTAHPELKVKAFFRTISPRHFFNGEWNTGGICENTTPLARGSEVREEWSRDEVVSNAVKGTKVKLLDITAISELRDEGHLSKYGVKATQGIMDCLHWCLPGVPDTWNEILAAQI